MGLDPYARRFLDRLALMNRRSVGTLTVSERRESLGQLLSLSDSGAVAEIEERTIPGPGGSLRVRMYTPEGVTPGSCPALVYFHGGGLVAGSVESYDAVCQSLARSAACRVLSVDYRLAPEHRFPAALADGCAAVRWMAAHPEEFGIDSERLIIGGDSAGATLAAVICQHLARTPELKLALQFLLCPIMDFRADTPSRRALRGGYLLDEETLEHDLEHYLPPGTDATDPRISPLRASDVAGLPASCVHTAEYDPLRDEGEAYSRRLETAGVRTLYRCHAGMIHLFYAMGAVIPYCAIAYELMGADIREMLAHT
jgi:acetyl esterase/lipase